MKRALITVPLLVLTLILVLGHRERIAKAAKPNAQSFEQESVKTPIDPQKSSADELREEFHQTYPLSATGRVAVENINGNVNISVWDQNAVKVDAIKRAYRRERLDEAKIDVNATADVVRIKTRYPEQDQTFTDEGPRRYNNPASVEYTLTVPRKARLESIETINGSLEIAGAEGDVRASSINGHFKASGLKGEVKLSTVNGRLEATFAQLDESKSISLNSVNGVVVLVIPSDANAQIRASTVHGGIRNDFGLPVHDGEYVGHELNGQLGTGGPRIRLNNVNGGITIKHAEDGRTMSKATSLLSDDQTTEAVRREEARVLAQEAREQAREQAQQARESARANAEAQRAARQAQQDAQREVAEAMREAQREIQRTQAEVQRAQNQIQRDVQKQVREATRINRGGGNGRFVDHETKSFTVSGTPSVNVGTFDGSVTVRGWDKQEVTYTATKRGNSDEVLKQITIEGTQQGSAVSIIAKSEPEDGSVAFEVFVPRNANVHLSSGDGHLSLQGVAGELVVRTGDGSIEIENGNGRLQANTGDGRIRISSFQGEVDARTGDGSIMLDGTFTAVSARTGDGSITLGVPAASNFVIETNADSITNNGLTVAEETSPSKRVKRWRVGSGGVVFALHTGDGEIILRPR